MGAPRQGPSRVPRRSVSCRVVRVNSHVLLRKVTAPGFGAAVREPEGGHYLDLRLFERMAHGRKVHIDPSTTFEHDEASHREMEPVERQFRATVPERAHDSAPVGISTMDRCLDEA